MGATQESYGALRPVPSPRARLARTSAVVGYWTPADVAAMVAAAERAERGGRGGRRRDGEREALLIRVLYVGALRVSEALALRPLDVGPGATLQIRRGKGGKARPVAITPRLVDALLAFAWRRGLDDRERFFPMHPSTAWRIVRRLARDAGCWVDGARPHLLRHSGAIERLRQSGNPRALQLHLGHATPDTTMRYLVTLQVEDALAINQAVDPER